MRKILIILLLLLSGLGLYSQSFTADDEDFVYGDVHIGDVIEFEQPNAQGGSPTKRGIVFYINPERTEGWAVELTNTSGSIRWHSSNDLISGLSTFSTAQVGSLLSDVDGYNNTRIIRQNYNLAPGASAQYAAGLVDFSNKWYLPAAGQLRKLYSVLPLLEQGATTTGFTTLTKGTSTSNARYWSSTQSSNTQAWYVQGWNSASSGGNLASYSKGQAMSVRAVRTFKLKPSKLSYLWSPTGDTIPDITVSPSQTTEYCVTVTYGDLQCTAEACQTVVVNPTQVVNVDTLACNSFVWNGVTYTTDAIIDDTLQSVVTGCDSIVHMTVTINPSYEVDDTHTLCQGETYTWQGHTFGDDAGTFPVTETLTAAAGCDSIVHMTVTVNPSYDVNDTHTLCQGETYTWQGHTFGTTAGTFTETETLTAAAGCDSIVHMTVTVNPS